MFELGGKLAVARHDRPSVLLCRDLAAALVEHRLDGEDHALAQFHPRTRPAEMEDIRFLVHLAPAAMAAQVAHARIAVPSRVPLDREAAVAEMGAGATLAAAQIGRASYRERVSKVEEISVCG